MSLSFQEVTLHQMSLKQLKIPLILNSKNKNIFLFKKRTKLETLEEINRDRFSERKIAYKKDKLVARGKTKHIIGILLNLVIMTSPKKLHMNTKRQLVLFIFLKYLRFCFIASENAAFPFPSIAQTIQYNLLHCYNMTFSCALSFL